MWKEKEYLPARRVTWSLPCTPSSPGDVLSPVHPILLAGKRGETEAGWSRAAGKDADLAPRPLSVLAFCGKTVLAILAQPEVEMLSAMRPKAPPHGMQGWRVSRCYGKWVKRQEEKSAGETAGAVSCSVQV